MGFETGYLAIVLSGLLNEGIFFMLFLSLLFVVVLFLLGFALTTDKGKHTIYARKANPPTNIKRLQKPTGVQINQN
ncbi:hypothetical protein [Aestuariibacter sp. A3R04]|uniref:hypothetical protein n=1 Tax=Aestuariibacter sp. A3R04 TaxID=2841571 RepID=UPI001C092337|nr:hypothetical protein [Aestuariibacter sp. A3R04]MBU3021507.1 hypothetical protein [Aestuariibacter sp. A3R04]